MAAPITPWDLFLGIAILASAALVNVLAFPWLGVAPVIAGALLASVAIVWRAAFLGLSRLAQYRVLAMIFAALFLFAGVLAGSFFLAASHLRPPESPPAR